MGDYMAFYWYSFDPRFVPISERLIEFDLIRFIFKKKNPYSYRVLYRVKLCAHIARVTRYYNYRGNNIYL